MSTRLTLVHTCEGICPDTDLVVFSSRVRIGFTHYAGCRDTQEGPGEDAVCEFREVMLADDPAAPVPPLVKAWAQKWFDSDIGQEAAFASVRDYEEEGLERQAEQRAEMRRFA